MAIDILNVKPNKVSTDARSYSLLLVGPPKIGKSTLMQELYGEKTLFIATEKRFGTMDGAYIAYVSDWVEFMQVLNQIGTPQAREMYDNVIIDTLDNLQRYLDDYVASHYDETVIGEQNNFGAEYKRAEVLWERAMKKIENSGLNYASVVHDKVVTKDVPFASLSKEEKATIDKKQVKDGVIKLSKRVADLDTRYNKHIEKSFDNVIFADYGVNQAGDNTRVLYLRGGLHNDAKVTLKDVPDVIPFSAEKLQETFKKALSSYSNTTSDRKARSDIKDSDYDYEELMAKAQTLSQEFVNLGQTKAAQAVVEDVLGTDTRVGDLTPNKVQELALVISALESKLAELS